MPRSADGEAARQHRFNHSSGLFLTCMSDIIKDNDYFESKLSESIHNYLRQVDFVMATNGATREQRMDALKAALRNLEVQMISVGQEPSTN